MPLVLLQRHQRHFEPPARRASPADRGGSGRRAVLRRKIHAGLRAGYLVEPAIRHLVWWLLTRTSPEPASQAACPSSWDFCKGRMWVLSDVGITPAGESLFSFTHRTFMEFFAAAHLAYGCDTPEQLAAALAPKLARSEWDVAGELAVQIKDRTSAHGGQRICLALLADAGL
jgi:hypothetical protein